MNGANAGWNLKIVLVSPSSSVSSSYASHKNARVTRSAPNDGSITSFQAIYIPADDFTDESVQTIISYMDGQIVLDRKIAELGIYPAINVFNSTSKLIDVERIGERHYSLIEQVLKTLSI